MIRSHFFVLTLMIAQPLSMALAQNSASPAPAPTAPAAASPATYVPAMTFEVASIRQSNPDVDNGFRVGGGFRPANSSHVILENNSFQNLLAWGYSEEAQRAMGFDNLPKELQHALFNVQAKADAATDERLAKLPKEEVRLEQRHMMQVLLAERFNLKVHWETRDSTTYDLVVSKRGRLQSTGARPSADEMKMFGDRGVPPLYQKGDSRYGFEYIAHGATAGDVAQMLAGQFGIPVIDNTGLTGKYDFDLRTFGVRSSDQEEGETNPWPPLETAIQDQLGLKLVRSHGPVRTLVIDHAEMPSPN